MTMLSDIHRAVRTAITSGRIGAPVFVRYLCHREIEPPAATSVLARSVAAIRDWLGQPLERIYASGVVNSRHATLTLEFRGGATALASWIGTPGRGDGVDVSVLGNHGAVYHDAGTASLGDDPADANDTPTEPALVAWIERALRSGRPEDAGAAP